MPRLAGARAALEYFDVPDLDRRAERYAAAKQEHLVRFIEEGRFIAFPDALRFILTVKDTGIRVAAASSSKNAKLFLQRIRLDTFAAEQRLDYGLVREGMTLRDLFDADISGRDFPRGKPDPMIFLTAARGARRFPGLVLRRSRTRRAASRLPRPEGWRRSAWPASATRDSWPPRAPTWW